jgi:hypothetical protein
MSALAAIAALGMVHSPAHAAPSSATPSADSAAVADIRRQIEDMRQQYEARLQELEAKLVQVQQAQQSPPTPVTVAAPASTDTANTVGTANAGGNVFNPMVSLILSGTYASLSKDPDSWRLSGFVPGGEEIGPGPRGFNLGESELTLSANIDPWWYGALTLAVSPEDTMAAEEAYVQTTALPRGFKLKVGRFYSGLGYLNEQHAHTWDFVDAPLAYQAFVGGQYKQDGVQLKWLAPSDQFIELGLELGNGQHFPGTARHRNSAGSIALLAHTGGDVGDSHNWRAGLGWVQTKAQDRAWDEDDASGLPVRNAFTGTSRMWVTDAVWKWAPHGNAKVTNFKLQGEYFHRTEQGDVVYDTASTASSGAYRSAQSGWYLQGLYQFTTGWRVGLRHDRLDRGTVDYGLNANSLLAADYNPRRDSLMLDWSPSEFSRWRLQWSNDRAREGVSDRQLFLQYQMSLGAHGAHGY